MMYETEARHYLREVLMAAIHRADEGCADWRIADALLDAGEITWNYQIRPEPQVATFQLIFTAIDAEPASGGVVEPPRLRPHQPDDVEVAKSRSAGWVFRCHRCDITRVNLSEAEAKQLAATHTQPVEPSGPLTAEEATPDCGLPNNPGGIFRPGTCKLPSGHPGWHEDGGLSWLRDREELERVVERNEHAPARRRHDPGALIEEPDLYEQGGHLDGEFAAERGKFDPLIGEQGEGDDRG